MPQRADEKLPIPIQFRIGAQLMAKVCQAANNSGGSRNAWLTAAVESLLKSGKPRPLSITAGDLLADKRTLTVRLLPNVVARVNKICAERGIPRTVWLLDACMSRISRIK